MNIASAIRKVTEHQDLTGQEMTEVMGTIMSSEATPAQIGGFLIGLRMKGETADEIAAAATVMRALATPVEVSGEHLVDTCGTGGDASGTFNISTVSALVAAAAGARVAKHGNRAVSGKSGSADVLEAAGVNLELRPAQVAHCIEEIGVGFLFAPRHHAAMRHVIGPRREMAVRTIFNLLGPLTNPAGAPNQLLGVFSETWVEPIAQVLLRLGARHALVVHAEDGLDEISISAPTRVAELTDGRINVYTLTPEQFGITRADMEAIVVDSVDESLFLIYMVLNGEQGPANDIVALNAGAAIFAAGVSESLAQGIEKAREAIASGRAKEKLEALVAFSGRFS
uniref:Anthranilate phosphoribosyltransferase n=1 Tax=Candidatus Kentrum sp. FM TaxID=2126340 RepID=A0A450VU45_9GAMM|nr:MAG: anthranilate phosphoribosyltransferase [Candidatus Kentron sp. FM]VFJ70397.1 MAG: anthranilate phosphoribosyltransferase [Candidatus Kentron sp. FM]VFK08305.1 MAG: anthranilate phosphoribosyltransferase [Candidatus Kentron sp. FM]